MPKPDVQYVPCLRCTRGRNGKLDCAAGFHARTLSTGCFNGAYLAHKAPKRYQGAEVARVEAPTYMAAVSIAREARHRQWIWVPDGIPGESHAATE